MAQNGMDVYAALKLESVLGTPPAATGAVKFPINRQQAPKLNQAQINSGAIRSNGQRLRPRGGSHSVTGSLIGDLTYEHVDVLMAALRASAWATDVLTPGIAKSSWTVEVYEQDIDVTTRSKGCRFGGYTQRGAPDQPVTHEYPLVGITQDVLTTTSAPFYTSPTDPSDDYMTTTDVAITIGGSPVASLTGWEVTATNGPSTTPVVGGKLSPDVSQNNLALSGSISMVRETAAMQQSYIANDPIDLAITSIDEAGNTFLFEYLNLFLADFTQPLGDDGLMIVTIPFTGGEYQGDPSVRITRTPAS